MKTETKQSPLDIVLNQLDRNNIDENGVRAMKLLEAAPALLAVCRDMLRYVQAGPIETAPDRLHCAHLLADAIAAVEGEQ